MFTLTATETEATFAYDEGGEGPRGTVTVKEGVYGPELWVNGRNVGFIDLAHEEGYPRLVVDHANGDTLAVIATFMPGGEVEVLVDPDGAGETRVFCPDEPGGRVDTPQTGADHVD